MLQRAGAREVLPSRAGIADWSADGNGVVRTGEGYEDSRRTFRLVYRGEAGKGLFHEIARANARKDQSLLRPFMFLPGGDHALAVRTNDAGREGIFEVDLNTLENVKEVYLAPEAAEIDGTRLSADGASLLGVSTSEVSGHIRWLDPELAELQAAFDKSVTGSTAHIISMSADRQSMLINLAAPNTPGALYYFSRNAEKIVRLGYYSRSIGSRKLGPVKVIHYKARDGLDIEAILTLPAGREAKKLPIVMMPHGGPWGQDIASWDYMAQYIASRGYAVLQPNFRGSTGYGAEFTRKGEGQMGFAMQDDITDGLGWAVKEGIADPARACIVGASYGGYAAMWGIIKDPDLYRCSISISGVANLRREVNDFGNSFHGGKFTDDWKKMTPDFAAVSPVNGIARIKVPLLLIHGRKDVTVDVSQSDSMAAKMRSAGKAIEYISLPKADHYFTRQPDRLVMLNAIGDFLAKNNPLP
jgi:dipeptidyl aminopeptidase/acylaminoacyl peptidase